MLKYSAAYIIGSYPFSVISRKNSSNDINGSRLGAVSYLPNIFIYLEADFLGGRLGCGYFQEISSY